MATPYQDTGSSGCSAYPPPSSSPSDLFSDAARRWAYGPIGGAFTAGVTAGSYALFGETFGTAASALTSLHTALFSISNTFNPPKEEDGSSGPRMPHVIHTLSSVTGMAAGLASYYALDNPLWSSAVGSKVAECVTGMVLQEGANAFGLYDRR